VTPSAALLLRFDPRELSVMTEQETPLTHARRVCSYMGWRYSLEPRIPAVIVVKHEGVELYRGRPEGFCAYLVERFGRAE
jgi:hypothetical protein